jgi:hypothetical protein
VNILLDNPMTQFSFKWILSLNWLCQKWGQVQFYVIQNGIRLTGMPAWGSGSEHDNQDSWKLVRFIRHLRKLTAEEQAEMKEMNPKSPDELKEEQEEREFLNGDQTHEHAQHENH